MLLVCPKWLKDKFLAFIKFFCIFIYTKKLTMKALFTKGNFKRISVIVLLIISSHFIKAQCSANFTYSVGAGGNVTFTSTSIGTNSNTSYYWSFDDGNFYWTMANINASNVYGYNGIFNVSLTITDSLAPCTSSIVITLTLNNVPCVGGAAFGYNTGQFGFVNFINNSSGIGANGSYTWGFGDGGTSNLMAPSHNYSLSGLYNVTLTATDQFSICSYSTVQNISVTVGSCTLASNFTFTVGGGGNVNFSSTSTGTTINTNYFWAFGDGSNGGGLSPSHTYSSNGMYNVYLSISDSAGFFCWDSISHNVNLNAPCFANVNFTMTKDSIALPAIVWNAIPNYPANIAAADWSWGDGTNTLALYPSHTYSAAGLYSICVSITVACGSTATACSNSNIYRTASSAELNTIAKVNVINNLPTVIKKIQAENFNLSLFPNPNDGEFELKIKGMKENNIEIKIYNLLGIEIFSSFEIALNGAISKKINLENFSNGTYFIKVISGNDAINSKLIVNK